MKLSHPFMLPAAAAPPVSHMVPPPLKIPPPSLKMYYCYFVCIADARSVCDSCFLFDQLCLCIVPSLRYRHFVKLELTCTLPKMTVNCPSCRIRHFAARCYASAAYVVMRCLRVCVCASVCACVSVTFVDHAKTNKLIIKMFSPSVATPF